MIEFYAFIATGILTSAIALLLAILRSKSPVNAALHAIASTWTSASRRTSSLVLTLLITGALLSFGYGSSRHTAALDAGTKATAQQHQHPDDGSDAGTSNATHTPDEKSLAAMRSYIDEIEGTPPHSTSAASDRNETALPDVNTMIATLVARLGKQPNDANGWKMLGWSYFNLGNPSDAATAYETALKLDPTDSETKAALERAQSAAKANSP